MFHINSIMSFCPIMDFTIIEDFAGEHNLESEVGIVSRLITNKN